MERSKVPISFAGQLDTKSNPKKVLPGRFTKIENARERDAGVLSKRYGYTTNPQTADGSTLTDVDDVLTFGDELLRFTDDKIYAWSSGAAKWIEKGDLVPCVSQGFSISEDLDRQKSVDMVVLNGLAYVTWSSQDSAKYAIVDISTNTVLVTSDIDSGNGSIFAYGGKWVVVGDYAFLFYYNPLTGFGELEALRFDSTDPLASPDGPYSIDSSSASNDFDIHATDGGAILVAVSITGGWRVRVVNTSGSTTVGPASRTSIGDYAITIAKSESTGDFYVLSRNISSTSIDWSVYDDMADLGSVTNGTSITTVDDVNNMVAHDDASSGTMQLYLHQWDSSPDEHRIYRGTIQNNGSAGSQSVWRQNVGLWSRPFNYNGEWYVTLSHEDDYQAQYWIVRSDGLVVSRHYPTEGYLNITGSNYSPVHVTEEEDGLYHIPFLRAKTFFFNASNESEVIPSVVRSVVDFRDKSLQRAELGRNLHILSASLQMYDGLSVVEHGFHTHPIIKSLAQSVSGGSMSDGTYSCVAVYEWIDQQGLLHRSAPSPAVSITVNGGGASQKITATVTTLFLTAKHASADFARRAVNVVLYCTKAGGTNYYRVEDPDDTTENDITAYSVSIERTLSDNDIDNRELLYTSGGVAANYPPPSAKTIAIWQQRILLGGLEFGQGNWFSKEYKDGEPVEFTNDQSHRITIPSSSGKVSAYGGFGEILYVFTLDRIFETYGDGPNQAGTLGQFAVPKELPQAKAGCDNPRSILLEGDVLYFQNAGRLYMLNAAKQVQYLAPLEGYNGVTITSAISLPDTDEIRFGTSDGQTLVHDTLFGKWYIDTGLASLGAVIHAGSYVLAMANGEIWTEDTGIWVSDGSRHLMTLETGWLSMDTIAGYQRVRRLFLIADYLSSHQLKIDIAYDGQDYTDTITLSPATELSGEYVYTVHLARQKCRSIRFKFTEVDTSTGDNSALKFSDFALEMAIKGGLSRMRAAQKKGAS